MLKRELALYHTPLGNTFPIIVSITSYLDYYDYLYMDSQHYTYLMTYY